MMTRRISLTVGLFLGVAVSISACATPAPILPEDVVSIVDDEGRMRTYDVAWQNTRMLRDMVGRQSLEELVPEALITLARVHRLASGEAGDLADRRTQTLLDELVAEATALSPDERLVDLEVTTAALIAAFDDGDFEAAEELALRVLAVASVAQGEADTPH